MHTARYATLALSLLCALPIAQAGLLGFGSGKQQETLLPAEQAFMLHAPLWDGAELIVGWDIAPGYYLYRDRIAVDAVQPEGYELGFASMPLGEAHVDAHFGETAIFRDQVRIRFRPKSGQPPQQIRVKYQGCAEDKVCYPSQTSVLNVDAR